MLVVEFYWYYIRSMWYFCFIIELVKQKSLFKEALNEKEIDTYSIDTILYFSLFNMKLKDELTFSEFLNMDFECWNYPLDEGLKCIKSGIHVVLVEFKCGTVRC